LGYKNTPNDSRTAVPFVGGETAAWKRIQEYFWDTKQISYYKKTRNGLLGKKYSSKLSLWMAFGSVSARSIYDEVKKYEKDVVKNDSTYWLIFELVWRDYFKYISLKHRNKIFKIGGILDKSYDWNTDKKRVQKWIDGNTPEPFVNANMRELACTGFMSNRGTSKRSEFFQQRMAFGLANWRSLF
jgi:deoxyribodipyrimidine photo-lyase